MANVTVIQRSGQVKGSDVTVTFHAVTAEQHTLTNTITDHPVETGYNASDHSRPDPDKVQFHAWISNTPLSQSQSTQAVQAGGFTIQTTAQSAAGTIGAVDGFSRGEWEKLKKLKTDGTIVTVVSTLGDYESMMIESLSVPRNAKNYDAVEFDIGFKLVRVVNTALTRVVTRSPQASKKKSAGTATTKDATTQDVDPLRKVVGGVQSGVKALSSLGSL